MKRAPEVLASRGRRDKPTQTLNTPAQLLLASISRDVSGPDVLLRSQGFEVATDNNGAAAVQTAVEFRPGVVLLDIGLPDMDGFKVARELRQIPELANSFLVALSGYGTAQDKVLALERALIKISPNQFIPPCFSI